MFSKTLDEDFEITGLWWFDAAGAEKFVGTLSYKPTNGIHLELLGPGNVEAFKNARVNPRIIWGTSKEAGDCTVFNAVCVHRSWSSLGIVEKKYSAQYLLVGDHVQHADEPIFSSCWVNYANLEEWLGTQPFKYDFPKQSNGLRGWRAMAERVIHFSARISSLNAEISDNKSISQRGDSYTTLEVRQAAFLVVKPETDRGIDWFRAVAIQLRDLISLFVGRSSHLLSFQLFRDREEPRKRTVDLYFRQGGQFSERIDRIDVMVPLAKIGDNVGEVFEAYFESVDRLRPVFELLLGTYFNPSPYKQFEFLNLVQALETFDRRTVEESAYIPKADFRELQKSTVIPAIEVCFNDFATVLHDRGRDGQTIANLSELKDLVVGRVRQANSVSLQTRISRTLESLPPNIVRMVTGDIENFGRKLVKTRDELTHYLGKEKDVLRGVEMINASMGLIILLNYLLLRELKLTVDVCVEIITSCERFRQFQFSEVSYADPVREKRLEDTAKTDTARSEKPESIAPTSRRDSNDAETIALISVLAAVGLFVFGKSK